eukprot:2627518-Pyramimonas_sp.AAC.1
MRTGFRGACQTQSARRHARRSPMRRSRACSAGRRCAGRSHESEQGSRPRGVRAEGDRGRQAPQVLRKAVRQAGGGRAPGSSMELEAGLRAGSVEDGGCLSRHGAPVLLWPTDGGPRWRDGLGPQAYGLDEQLRVHPGGGIPPVRERGPTSGQVAHS